jgi:hypothetical protein
MRASRRGEGRSLLALGTEWTQSIGAPSVLANLIINIQLESDK